MTHTPQIRKPSVAGSFYPDIPDELNGMLETLFTKTGNKTKGRKVKALIVPHAGYIYSGQTAAWGYKQLQVNNIYETKKVRPHFVLIGPSHNYYFNNIVSNSFAYWETPLGKITHSMTDTQMFPANNEAFIPEHCLEVQIPFLQYTVKDFSISCLLTGTNVNKTIIAEQLAHYYSSSVFIISTDLSHYLPESEALVIDKKTINAILSGDGEYFQTCDNAACGGNGICILMEIAEKNQWKPVLLYYDTSATASGDTERAVGYAAIVYFADN